MKKYVSSIAFIMTGIGQLYCLRYQNRVLKIIAIALSVREDSKNGQFCTLMMTGSLFKNQGNMDTLRLETTLGLSEYAC